MKKKRPARANPDGPFVASFRITTSNDYSFTTFAVVTASPAMARTW